MCPTGSTFIKTASTGELEEHIAATTGAITVASTSADVAVSSAVTTCRQSAEEQRVQAMNTRKPILELATYKEALSLQANLAMGQSPSFIKATAKRMIASPVLVVMLVM